MANKTKLSTLDDMHDLREPRIVVPHNASRMELNAWRIFATRSLRLSGRLDVAELRGAGSSGSVLTAIILLRLEGSRQGATFEADRARCSLRCCMDFWTGGPVAEAVAEAAWSSSMALKTRKGAERVHLLGGGLARRT